jgi:hypothetical protein
VVESYEPPLNFPEFKLRLNVKANKRKSVFIADDGKMNVQDAIGIAKEQASKMGMGNKDCFLCLKHLTVRKRRGGV